MKLVEVLHFFAEKGMSVIINYSKSEDRAKEAEAFSTD